LGDVVRIRDVAELRALGLAGRAGEIRWKSVPSVTRVPVAGPTPALLCMWPLTLKASLVRRMKMESGSRPSFWSSIHRTIHPRTSSSCLGRSACSRTGAGDRRAGAHTRPASRAFPKRFPWSLAGSDLAGLTRVDPPFGSYRRNESLQLTGDFCACKRPGVRTNCEAHRSPMISSRRRGHRTPIQGTLFEPATPH
jgi:hypothetical protein